MENNGEKSKRNYQVYKIFQSILCTIVSTLIALSVILLISEEVPDLAALIMLYSFIGCEIYISLDFLWVRRKAKQDAGGKP
jgi:hypothetical protein